MPKLTVPMVARLQGWSDGYGWRFSGGKTAQYRQIGNAFPPPVAEAIGRSIKSALLHEGPRHEVSNLDSATHDPIYRALASASGYVTLEHLHNLLDASNTQSVIERKLAALSNDFEVEVKVTSSGTSYRLGKFKGFTGQLDHERHLYMEKFRNRVS
jgi:DNA (cytosine-5)-methyltransferase 1